MKASEVNGVIRNFFKNNNIKFGSVAELLGISKSNLTERFNSPRSFTLDEFMLMYARYGDNFGLAVMNHYGAQMLYLGKIRKLIGLMSDLELLFKLVKDKNKDVFEIIGQIEEGIKHIDKSR
jgi:hypothetical protein